MNHMSYSNPDNSLSLSLSLSRSLALFACALCLSLSLEFCHVSFLGRRSHDSAWIDDMKLGGSAWKMLWNASGWFFENSF